MADKTAFEALGETSCAETGAQVLYRPPGDIWINSLSDFMFTVSIVHVSRTPAWMTIFGWKVDDGVEKLSIPTSDFQIHSFCDEIPAFNGKSVHDVLRDWCDVLSFTLSSEGIVILIANKSLTSSQAVTQQRTDLSVHG